MPKNTRKCQMYIARITYRAAQRAAARVTWVKLRNGKRQHRQQNRFQSLPATLMSGVPQAMRAFGNPFAGKWPRRQQGWRLSEKLHQRRAAVGGVA